METITDQSPADETPSAPKDANPFSLKKYSPGVRKIASFGLTLYILGLAVAAIWAPHYWAISVLFSSACMALGWTVGFLFGIPRASSNAGTTAGHVNTNLEQISDWLTKILVGVGLTQLERLPGALREVAAYISKQFGPSANDVFSLSMVLYFSTIGFLIGYLLTRLALQQEFEEAESGDIHVSTQGSTEVKVTQPAPEDETPPKPGEPEKPAEEPPKNG